MRRRHALYALVGALGLVFAVRPSSHELYLLGLPGLAPAKGAATKLVAKSEIYQVRPGSEVRLVLRDSTVVAGTFLGTTLLPAEEWTTRYAAARESLLADGPFPAIGDTVEAHRRHEIPVRGSLEGFGFRTVVVRRQVPGTLHEVPFEDLLMLDGETWNVPQGRLALAASRGGLPSMVAVVVAQARDTTRVPADRVAVVMASDPASGATAALGVLLGIGLGVGLVVLLGRELQKESDAGCEEAVRQAPKSSYRAVPPDSFLAGSELRRSP